MTFRGAIVLRPEPGNGRTAARLAAAGAAVRQCPLFRVAPVPWAVPDPRAYDALLLTSANAARHAGPGLAALHHLPTLAVGAATAAAACDAGLSVALTGEADATTLVAAARAQRWTRLLHLAGRDRGTLPGIDQRTVYVSDPIDVAPTAVRSWTDHVALLHSARAARHFAMLTGADRPHIGIAAISDEVALAAGDGWAASAVALAPTDEALVAAAAALIDRARAAADKRGA